MRNVSRDAYADDHGPVWSPWGTHVAHFSNRDGGWDIYTLDLETGERDNLTSSALLEQSPHWGP
jgi:Tol biopolymer transport system component